MIQLPFSCFSSFSFFLSFLCKIGVGFIGFFRHKPESVVCGQFWSKKPCRNQLRKDVESLYSFLKGRITVPLLVKVHSLHV